MKVDSIFATTLYLLGGRVLRFSDAFAPQTTGTQKPGCGFGFGLPPIERKTCPSKVPTSRRRGDCLQQNSITACNASSEPPLSGGPDRNSDLNKVEVSKAIGGDDDDAASSPRDENSKIELQKLRALALWEKACNNAKKSIPDDVQKQVRDELNRGMVPPIFHALVREGKPLFPSSTHTLSFSIQPVEPGEAEPDLADTVIPTFLGDESDHDVPSVFLSNGIARLRVKEFDATGSTWRYSEKQARTAADLVNTAATMIGEDIEVTAGLASIPFIDYAVAAPYNLLTRQLSRGVVASCFDSSREGSQRAITGSSGIGKTWTLLYALQQALLYDNAVVVFYVQKEGRAICYIRKESRIFAWFQNSNTYPASSLFFSRSDVLILLDPIDAHEGGASYLNGDCMFIFAACNNEAHFKNDIFKSQDAPQRFLSPWAEDELRVALPNMFRQVSIETALFRAEDVGLLPRYLVDDEMYSNRKYACMAALEDIRVDPQKVRSIISWNGRDSNFGGRISVAGTIFSVHAAVRGDTDDDTDNEEDDDSAGDANNDSLGLPVQVGYDGEGVLYTEQRLRIMSPYVDNTLSGLSRVDLLLLWRKSTIEKGSTMGCSIENLFWEDDLDRFVRGNFSMVRWKQTNGSKAGIRGNLTMSVGCSKVPDRLGIEDLGTIFNSDNMICRMKEGGTAAIDFAGPGRKVYQVSVSKSHALVPSGLLDIFIQCGYVKIEKGKPVLVEPVPPAMLEFMWVVPKGEISSLWKRRVPRTVKKDDALYGDVLNWCLINRVEQYVVEMDPDPDLLLAAKGESYRYMYL